MFEKLSAVEKKFEEINEKLCDPQVVSDIEQYTSLMKEIKNLTPVVEKFREYKKLKESYDEAKMLLDEGGLEKDFREMVQQEYEEAEENMEKAEQELKVLLLPKDPNDDRNVIVEIRGGAGGEEAALFAGTLFRMYSMYAETKGWKPEILSSNPTELGGFKEVSFMIEGEGAYSRFKFESGVHRVQRVPETESQGRIHTSTVTVAVQTWSEREDKDEININDAKQEKTSLSSRFGIKILYMHPDRINYLNIVDGLAEQYGLKMDREELHQKALTWEIRHGGFSGRTAKQFINAMLGK